MKVLIVMNYRSNWGGLTAAVEELARSLKAEGLCVYIASTHGKIKKRIKNIANILKVTMHYDFIMATGCGYYGFFPIFIGVIVARIYRKKVLVDFHEGYPDPFMRRFGAIIRLFLRNIPVIVASGYLLNIFKKYKLNVSLIPYHFHYEDFPKRERSFSWNKKFIWAGQFQSMYDPETALKACEVVLKQRDDVEFDFFGDGPLLNGLKKRYSGPKIKFNGFIPRNDLLREYQQYCIFLNTSFGDNFPLRLVEAAFYELLVISSRSSGTATIYNDKECLFFEKGDYRKLSEYILNVMEKPHLYDSLRENIHRKIMSFTWDSVKGDWLKLLKG